MLNGQNRTNQYKNLNTTTLKHPPIPIAKPSLKWKIYEFCVNISKVIESVRRKNAITRTLVWDCLNFSVCTPRYPSCAPNIPSNLAMSKPPNVWASDGITLTMALQSRGYFQSSDLQTVQLKEIEIVDRKYSGLFVHTILR